VIGVAGAAKASSIIGANSSSMEGSDIAADSGVEYTGRFADAGYTRSGGYLMDFILAHLNHQVGSSDSYVYLSCASR
jgi:hypothetical protein